MTARRTTTPNPAIDPAVDEMLHSLFDGRAKHRYVSDYDPTSQDKSPRNRRITLATVNPDYLR